MDTSTIQTKAALRAIKNAVIGNPSAKAAHALEEKMQIVLESLNPEHVSGSLGPSFETRVEAANVIYSLSSGSKDALLCLLRADTASALLYALSTLHPTSPASLKSSLGRAVRALISSCADVIGPSLWGMTPLSAPQLRERARLALDQFFHPDSLDIWIPLLQDHTMQPFLMGAIGNGLRSSPARQAVGEWVPPAERAKESKGRRGWEKPEVGAAHKGGGWVCRHLVGVVSGSAGEAQSLVQVLYALMALGKDSPALGNVLRVETDGHSPMQSIILVLRSRSVDARIAAAYCLTNLVRSQTHHGTRDNVTVLAVIHALNNLIMTKNESQQVRMRACFVLSHLLADDLVITQTAVQCGSLTHLLHLHEEVAATENPDEDEDEDEPAQLLELRESVYTALATVALHDNTYRREILMSESIIPSLSASLSSSHLGVRYSSTQLTRVVSRSIDVLRRSIAESDMPTKILEIIKLSEGDERWNRSIVNAALAALANMVNDFAPLREPLIKAGGLKRVVELTKSNDEAIRLNAAWVLKNTMSCSTWAYKQAVMAELTWESLIGLTNDVELRVREQGLSILQNLTTTQTEIAYLINTLTAATITNILHASMTSSDGDVVLRATYILSNIISGTDNHCELVLSSRALLSDLCSTLSHPRVDVRRTAVRAVLGLLSRQPNRYRDLRDVGIESAMRAIHGGRGRTASTAGIGEYVGMASAGGTHGASTSMDMGGSSSGTAGLMGREEDREVRETVKQALLWFELAREKDATMAHME